MAGATQRTHYQVLGIAPSVGIDEIRRAHRQLARVLHPDRLADASAAERQLAERRMREVNVAWSVLSDEGRRRDYDRSLRADAGRVSTGRDGAASASAGHAGGGCRDGSGAAGWASQSAGVDDSFGAAAELDPDEPALSAWQYWLLRRGPIVAALVVAAVLFVVTAYAGGGGESPATTVAARDCVRVIPGREAVPVSCDGPNNGTIVTTVEAALDCPAGTRYVLVGGRFTCIDGDAGRPDPEG